MNRRALPLVIITTTLAVISSVHVAATHADASCTQCFAPVGGPKIVHLGAFYFAEVTYLSTVSGPVDGAIVYGAIRNSLGQTVSISTDIIAEKVQPTTSVTSDSVLFGLMAGSYSETIFAIYSSGFALSPTVTVAFTVLPDGTITTP